jgi:hypothetical protein
MKYEIGRIRNTHGGMRNAYAYNNLVVEAHLEYTGVDRKKGNIKINLGETWCDADWVNLVQDGDQR